MIKRRWWVFLLLGAGCASAPPAPTSGGPAYAGNFGGNTFDLRSVSGKGVSLARDGDGRWNGTMACRWRQGIPTGKMCPFFWEPTLEAGLPIAIGAPGVGAFSVARMGHTIIFRGQTVEFRFAAAAEREFPSELVAPLFFAVANTSDPARDLRASEPPLDRFDFTNPQTLLVWVVSVEGLGDVSVRRGPASGSPDIKPGAAGILYHGP